MAKFQVTYEADGCTQVQVIKADKFGVTADGNWIAFDNVENEGDTPFVAVFPARRIICVNRLRKNKTAE